MILDIFKNCYFKGLVVVIIYGVYKYVSDEWRDVIKFSYIVIVNGFSLEILKVLFLFFEMMEVELKKVNKV